MLAGMEGQGNMMMKTFTQPSQGVHASRPLSDIQTQKSTIRKIQISQSQLRNQE